MKKVLLSAAAFALIAGCAGADIVLDDFNTVTPYDGDGAIWADPAITDHAVISQEANGFNGSCLKCVYSYNGAAVTYAGYHDWQYATKTFEEPINLGKVSGFSMKMKVDAPDTTMRLLWYFEDVHGNQMRLYEKDSNFNFAGGEWRNVLMPLCQASVDIPSESSYPVGLGPSQWMNNGRPIDIGQIVKVGIKVCDMEAVTSDGTVTFYLDDFVAIENEDALNETTLWSAEDFEDDAAMLAVLSKIHATQAELTLGIASDGSKCIDTNFTYIRWGGFGIKLAADLTTPIDLTKAAYVKVVFESDPLCNADTSARGLPLLQDTPGNPQAASRAIPYYCNNIQKGGGRECVTIVPFNNPTGIGYGSQYNYTWCSAWAADDAGKINLANICNIYLQFDTNMSADLITATHKLKKVIYANSANTPSGPAAVSDWSLM